VTQSGEMTVSIDSSWISTHIGDRCEFYALYVNEFLIGDIVTNNYKAISDTLLELIHFMSTTYADIHPEFPLGYPFYWIGFSFFKLQRYDQAIFYLDAALAEDKHYMKEKTSIADDGTIYYGWTDSGAALFFKLYHFDDANKVFNVDEVRIALDQVIDNFNMNNTEKIVIDHSNQLIDKFICQAIREKNTAIITTLYSYILLRRCINI
jgi:tetratricopeptide (TPR) repeat protein